MENNKLNLRDILSENVNDINDFEKLLNQPFELDSEDIKRLYIINHNYQNAVKQRSSLIKDKDLGGRLGRLVRDEYPIASATGLAFVHNNLKELGVENDYLNLIKQKMFQLPLYWRYRKAEEENPGVFKILFPNYKGSFESIDLGNRDFSKIEKYVIKGSLLDVCNANMSRSKIKKPENMSEEEWILISSTGVHDISSGFNHLDNNFFGFRRY